MTRITNTDDVIAELILDPYLQWITEHDDLNSVIIYIRA